ncbi:MAG: esterase [Akkermansiaceae bacterium]|nr:esterase [Akkermansiaceae bacterium]
MKPHPIHLILGSLLAGMIGTLSASETWQPSATNQPGRQFPKVDADGRVRARVEAPGATSVQLDIGAVKYPLAKGEDGVWIGESEPQDEGFHYYQLVIDGAQVPDPGSLYFYGAGRWGSGVEVPAKDRDFYALKDVPHGDLRETHYRSKTSKSDRRIFVYTPPQYDSEPQRRFPVLYLQHGMGENETGWGNQGHAGLIMDNLIAAGKAEPFLIVMENGLDTGNAEVPESGPDGRRRFDFRIFERILVDDLIPFIDSRYRTLPDQPHRAMAGLSMGGMQTRTIAPAHLDLFSAIGVFSGGSIKPGDIKDLDAFKKQVRLVFFSFGGREQPGAANAKADAEALKESGLNSHYYESPETGHEWQSWRRSLHQFAQLLFRD